MHAQRDPGQTDQRHQHADPDDHRLAPARRHRRQEHQQQGPVRDERAERVPAGEAVARCAGDRHVHDRAEPADQRLQRRVEDQTTDPGDDQIDGQSGLAPDQQPDHGDGDQPDEDRSAAQVGHRLQDGDECVVRGDESVEPFGDGVVGVLQRAPPHPDEHQQQPEGHPGAGDGHQAGDAPFGEMTDRTPCHLFDRGHPAPPLLSGEALYPICVTRTRRAARAVSTNVGRVVSDPRGWLRVCPDVGIRGRRGWCAAPPGSACV